MNINSDYKDLKESKEWYERKMPKYVHNPKIRRLMAEIIKNLSILINKEVND